MELINYVLELANIDKALLLKVAPIMALVMGCLYGCYAILEAVSKFTKTEADDKAAGVFKKVIDGLKKIVDILMGNPKH